jgi:hypothetical protein
MVSTAGTYIVKICTDTTVVLVPLALCAVLSHVSAQ